MSLISLVCHSHSSVISPIIFTLLFSLILVTDTRGNRNKIINVITFLPFGSFSSQESSANFSFFLLLSKLHRNLSDLLQLGPSFFSVAEFRMNYFELQNLLFRSDIDRTVTIFCKILNLQIDGLGANIKILCRSVAEQLCLFLLPHYSVKIF